MLSAITRRHLAPVARHTHSSILARGGRNTPYRDVSRSYRPSPRGQSPLSQPPPPPGVNASHSIRTTAEGTSTGLTSTSAVALLIGANVLMTLKLNHAIRNHDGKWCTFLVTSPMHISAGYVHTLLSSTFVQGTSTDLALTLGALWWFGRPVARALGTARFLGTYLACVAATSLVGVAHRKRVTSTKHSHQWKSDNKPLAISAVQTPGAGVSSVEDLVFGSGGAVNATVVLYTVLVPHASFAPFVYFVLCTIKTGFISNEAASFSRDVGYTSGILWGGLAAARFRNSLRLIR